MMGDDNQHFYGQKKEGFKPLRELYKQWIRSESDASYDLDLIMEKMINIGFPILNWGKPPEILGGQCFFHEEKEFLLEGKTSAKLSIIFQLVLSKLIEQSLLEIDYNE